MRILIVHNTLWAHYKSVVFGELQRLSPEYDSTVHVLQIARSELSRAALGRPEEAVDYSYELLFDDYIERVGLMAKTRKLIDRLLAFRPDVVTLTGYYDPAQLAVLMLAKLKGIKVILQSESTVVDQARTGLKEALKKWIIARCDGFFCFGTHSADYLLSLGARPEQILLKKNAVDNARLKRVYAAAVPQRDQRQRELGLPLHNFIYVGRLIPPKNLPGLLRAFHSARRQSPTADWGLILLGDGEQRAELERLTEELELTGRVRFIDGKPWYEVPDYLALADVLVLPSSSEPWGLVVNEAMVCGLPVLVSSRCGCAVDLVSHGKNGYVFDPERPEELTRYLAAFQSGEADRSRMSEASRQMIAPFAPAVVAREMWEGFGKVYRNDVILPAPPITIKRS